MIGEEGRFEMFRTEADDGSMSVAIDYLPDAGEYEITVRVPGQGLSQRMPARGAPERGMDLSEHAHAIRIATALAERLESGDLEPDGSDTFRPC